MPGDYVYIASEIGVDYDNVIGVWTQAWAEAVANRLEFTAVNTAGDRAYFNVKGEDYTLELHRVVLDA